MEAILGALPAWVELISVALTSLVILATVIVRVTPSSADDEQVSKFAGFVMKIISYLPTIGLNPKTKKLQEYYDEMKKKNEPK